MLKIQPVKLTFNGNFSLQSFLPVRLDLSSHPVVLQVDTSIVQLTENPSICAAVSKQLTILLNKQPKEDEMYPALLKEVATVIFEQGVGDPQFRYAGGKLVQHLCENVDGFSEHLFTM